MGDQDNPSAAGPACISWDRYEVPQLAAFLSEDTEPAWSHARAWQRTMELADGYGRSMQEIRDGFAAIWSPDHSQAAQMFLGRLDMMIAALTDVRESASSNYTALTGVLQLWADAKSKIDELNGQYRTASSDQRSLLNQQARRHMGIADDEVLTYYTKLTKPAPYNPSRAIIPGSLLPADGSVGASGSAGSGSVGSSGSERSSADRRVLPWVGQSTSPAGDAAYGSTSTPMFPGGSPVADPGPMLTGDLPANNGPDGFSNQPVAPVPGASPSGPGSLAEPWWMVDTPRGPVMRYGAVIGMPPPDPAAHVPGGFTESSGSRVAASGEPVAGETSEHAGGLVGGGGGAGTRAGQRRRHRSEPYYQWEAPTGVPPVIEPGPEPKHDPGPGVIGIDRW